jgi:hypothetical protein
VFGFNVFPVPLWEVQDALPFALMLSPFGLSFLKETV